MAYIVIEVNVSSDSIADLNTKCQKTGNAQASIAGVQNLLNGLLGGAKDGTVKIVTKDASTSISTSGTGSTSNTFDLS